MRLAKIQLSGIFIWNCELEAFSRPSAEVCSQVWSSWDDPKQPQTSDILCWKTIDCYFGASGRVLPLKLYAQCVKLIHCLHSPVHWELIICIVIAPFMLKQGTKLAPFDGDLHREFFSFGHKRTPNETSSTCWLKYFTSLNLTRYSSNFKLYLRPHRLRPWTGSIGPLAKVSICAAAAWWSVLL